MELHLFPSVLGDLVLGVYTCIRFCYVCLVAFTF
jgi:hypothetical protein